MYKIPELLAPAGTFESIRAAVNGGADAVYFGGKAFNARRNAANMDEAEMEKAIALCRKHGVRVYVTLNILIKDNEMEALVSYLNLLSGLEIDGLIVQDPGLIYLLQKYFPDFKLQTSTQGSVYGLQGTLFFEKAGFARVVLPREMPLEEAAEIAEKVKTEVKLFCHGALCYAYSGQCLMSSMIGGRSGNRGLCAQPCRKKYQLIDQEGQMIKEGYLLSMKDLNIKENLAKVVQAGISSLKIEGRMKSPEYVYAVTRAYREALDIVAGKQTELSITEKELAQVFNRSFTEGRLFKDQQVINDVVGRNRGVRVGSVVGNEKGKLVIKTLPDTVLAVGDGLSFGEDSGKGLRVDVLFDFQGHPLKEAEPGMKVKVPSRFKVPSGTPVYRNHDAFLAKRLELESSAAEAEEKIPVRFALKFELGKPVQITAQTGAQEVSLVSDIIPDRAQKSPLSYEMLVHQFERLGGTRYTLEGLEADIAPNIFLSKGELNTLRREALAEIETVLIKQKPEKSPLIQVDMNKELPVQPEPKKRFLSLEITDTAAFEACCALDVDELVLPVEDLSCPEACQEKIRLARGKGKQVLLAFPRIMNTAASEELKAHLEDFLALDHEGILLKNYEVLNLLAGQPVYKEADQSFNLFNGLAMKQMENWQVNGGVLSPELSAAETAQVAACSPIDCVLPVYGRQEIMVSANCVYNCADKQCAGCRRYRGWSALVDGRGAVFPLRKDKNNVIHIYNGDVLFLKNELEHQRHIKKWRIYGTDETPETLAEVVDYYRNALNTGFFKKGPECAGVRYTKGNFKRGVE